MNHKVFNTLTPFPALVEQEKDLDIESGITMFLNHTRAERSIQTYNYYNKHLKVILNYLKERGIIYFREVTTTVLDEFVIHEREIKNNKNITINKRVCALKSVSKFLCSINLLSTSLVVSKLK
ncbi:MAG: site-specific integrase, partial [Anaeroplasmataceae bacterium]|nr:site-specific integrase [Anaeroplasmataceae bacterium]